MKRSLLSAIFVSVSVAACGTTTEPVLPRPDAVSIRDVSAGDGTVTITFTETASASGQYLATCQSSGRNYTAMGKASPITITGLTNGVRYSCTVIAVRSNASSDPSTAVFATPGQQLYSPSILSLLTPGNASATAEYSLPSEFLQDPRPWFVTVTCSGAGTVHTAASTDSVIRGVTVTGLQNGVTYSCALRITSASGVAISRQLDVVPGTPMRPLAPNATPGNASAALSFQASADNGFAVTGYTGTCTATGQQSRTVNGPSSPLVVTSLTNGILYSCTVYASNTMGPGENSASMPVTPGIPTAVKSITATTTSNAATFAFSAPDSDNGSAITSYTITCAPFGPAGIQQPIPTASGAASPITVTGLLANWPYDCVIFATNSNGNGLRTYVGVTTKP
jgi:hypothetical protein